MKLYPIHPSLSRRNRGRSNRNSSHHNRMHRARRLAEFAFLCVILISSLLLTGCGSSEESVPASPVESVDDLEGKTIGVQLGTAEDLSASEIKDATVEEYNSGAEAVQALLQGKLDCVIMSEVPAQTFVSRNSGLSILDDAYATESAAICVAKGNTKLTNKLNEILATFQADGTLDQIIGNYIGDATKGKQPYQSPSNVDRSNGTLVVATNAEFEPYEYVENGKIVGIDIELAQAIADKLGMELQIDDMHFASIINAVQSGKADVGIAGMAVTEDRLKNVDFTNVYKSAKQVVIVRNGATNFTSGFRQSLYQNFIKDDRYQSLLKGLGITLFITLFAGIIALALGLGIAFIRFTADKLHTLRISNFLMKVYLAVIRGTPSVIQLLIIYYVIFASINVNKILVAIVAFGLNSAAYVAEIIRSGWESIDNGQYEAGRSLGFSYFQTMRHFILPQAVRNVTPALGNEMIALLKSTAISGYIGIIDLTRAGDFIRSRTYEALMPLLTVAVIYLIIVILMSLMVYRIERRLKRSERF